MARAHVFVAAALSFFAGCHTGKTGISVGPAQHFDGLGEHRRKITTSSEKAQRSFDQGLVWTFAFNHDEAIRSYTEAARLDPGCAMAWWGVALCHGPHINFPLMTPESSAAAWTAIQKALALKIRTNPTERALIDALSKRYADPPPADRRALDEAYAAAMGEVWRAHPADADIGTLYAESLMDLQPWDLWTKDGTPKGRASEIVSLLEDVLAKAPNHPGALHLYIHATEASAHPERTNAAADQLRDLVPASGHLVHMPSHIDVLTGRWEMAATQNEKAIKADQAYRKKSPRQGFYNIYMAHNHHMLCFASMMEGRGSAAIRAARQVVAGVPEEYGRTQAALIDPFMASPYEAMTRFGRWDEMLREPAPPEYWPISTAMWRFSRGVAFAAKGDVEAAEREQAAFREAVTRVPEGAMMMINPAHKILEIAGPMLAGEIALRRGQIDESVAQLRLAVAAEDDLMYMEPPEWIQPVRHTLGAVLTSAGRHSEAEAVYRADLEKWPENGWSLYGLAQCLRSRNATAEAAEVEKRFEKAWARADVKIGSSCLCVPGERITALHR